MWYNLMKIVTSNVTVHLSLQFTPTPDFVLIYDDLV